MRSEPPNGEKSWSRVEELYHEALSKPREQRAQFLESACRGDEGLRREVASLLNSLEKDGARLEARALEVAARMVAKGEASLPAGPQLSLRENPSLAGKGSVDELPGARGVLPETAAKGEIRRRAPLWLYFLAAIFVADCLMRAYCFVLGPEPLGFATRTKEGQEVIVRVSPGYAAEHAGLKTGDIILALDGQPTQSGFSWNLINYNLKIGRSYRFDIERNHQRIEVPVRVERVKIGSRRTHTIWQIDGLFLLATALFITFARPFDRLARMGALALATLSIGLYSTLLPPGYAVIWRDLPQIMGALLWIPHVCVYLFGPIGLTFFALFPRPLFRARWPWAIIWLPALLFVPFNLYSNSLVVYFPARAYLSAPPDWVRRVQFCLYAAYGLADVAALATNYVRLTDTNERRRLVMLVLGGIAGVLPGLLRIPITTLAPESAISRFLNSGVPNVFIAVIFVLFPICFAYSILRHRLFDIRVIIRLGLQYAMARGGLIALVPALGIILFLDMLAHGHQPFIDILGARGWVYAAMGAVAIVAHMQRQRWGEAIDRRFFREHYDTRRLLRDVAQEARQAGSFSRAVPGRRCPHRAGSAPRIRGSDAAFA